MIRPNVIVTAASRRVALVQGLQRALARLSPHGRVIATDIDPYSPAVHLADAAEEVPRSDHPDYVDALLAVCAAHDAGVLVPTIDDELETIAAASDRFAAAGVVVMAPDVDTARICRDKLLTATHLERHGIRVAATWSPEQVRRLRPLPPLFIKPRCGRGSVGAFRVGSSAQLRFFLDYVPDPVVQEYLEGPEFTIDLFCDLQGRPIAAVPRERLVIRSGVTDRGRTVTQPGTDGPGRALRRGPAVQGRRQRAVSGGGRDAGDLRDQPAFQRWHPVDDRGGRRLRGVDHPRRHGARPCGRGWASSPTAFA